MKVKLSLFAVLLLVIACQYQPFSTKLNHNIVDTNLNMPTLNISIVNKSTKFYSRSVDHGHIHFEYYLFDDSRKDSLVYYWQDSILHEKHKLVIKTFFLKDETLNVDNMDISWVPSPVKQTLYFYLNDSLLKVINYDSLLCKVHFSNLGKVLEVLKNRIHNITIYKGKKGWLYCISSESINYDGTFHAYYESNGNFLYQYKYYKEKEDFKSRIGSFEQVKKKYGNNLRNINSVVLPYWPSH